MDKFSLGSDVEDSTKQVYFLFKTFRVTFNRDYYTFIPSLTSEQILDFKDYVYHIRINQISGTKYDMAVFSWASAVVNFINNHQKPTSRRLKH